ncbi:DUF3899 domain-containing protein [Tuberibacillus sp. Marseille-P3662]|uniref:DUF3899 domain-containing protein n=1 Tax=Tuberibacillus sp. Marseille-P3662 TaxID=1965358 RepID=UPI000A1CD13B|nr:DUF3899 domain-containing protein [Tuberibacillus sp. Marseille-P3662]
MTKFQLYLSSFISSVILSVLITFLIYKQINMLTIVNGSFLVGLFYLIVGLVLYIIQGGFFNGITYSFRRFFRRTSRQGDIMNDISSADEEEALVPKDHDFPWTYPILISGCLLGCISMALAYTI